MCFKKSSRILFSVVLTISQVSFSQNLLSPLAWTVGQNSAPGYVAIHPTFTSSREIGKNHVGQNVVLWKSTPNQSFDGGGGWDSDFITIQPQFTYRFSVWIKKTNSNSGNTHFGCGGNNDILNFSNVIDNNPFFFAGDLPKLNRWYLLVGYVHSSNHFSQTNMGKIYDGETMQEVVDLTDFKFSTTATMVRHKSFLWDSDNNQDRQYYYDPRLEKVDGSEIALNELFKINADSKLLFSYDAAGNQSQRFYCSRSGCTVPVAPLFLNDNEVVVESVKSNKVNLSELESHSVIIYPNPTKNLVSIRIESINSLSILDISLYNLSGNQVVKNISINGVEAGLDLSNLSSGVYLAHYHLSNGESGYKRIIKL